MGNQYVLYFVLSMIFGHTAVWLQINSPLVWKSLQNINWLIAIAGVPVSYLFIKANQWGYVGFEEKLWPLRLIGFVIGTVIFALLTALVMHELPDTKTIISLVLCALIVIIQIW